MWVFECLVVQAFRGSLENENSNSFTCVCVLGLFVLAFWAALKNEQVKTTAVTSPSVQRTALLRGNSKNVKVSNVVLCFVQIALKA